MGNAGGQQSDGRELLRLGELRFQLDTIGDVVNQDDTADGDEVARDQGRDGDVGDRSCRETVWYRRKLTLRNLFSDRPHDYRTGQSQS